MPNLSHSRSLRGNFTAARGLLFFFLAMTGLAFANQDADTRIHDWLGWGEFDSAVVALEKRVQDSGLSQSLAATQAKYWSWLGIAFHGRMQSQAGDSAFRRTLAIKADYEIEANLVTRDLARRFHDLAESQKQANQLRDSVVLAKLREAALMPRTIELIDEPKEDALAEQKNDPKEELEKEVAPKPRPSRNTAIWWKSAAGAGAAGVLIAGGIFAYLTLNSTSEKAPAEKIWDIPSPK